MKVPGCLIVLLGGGFAAVALIPVANLAIQTSDLQKIALIVYAELALLNLIGGIILALREPDLASGMGNGIGVAAFIYIAVYFSYNYAAHSDYDLRGNPFYDMRIGIPLALACCWVSVFLAHQIRKRRGS